MSEISGICIGVESSGQVLLYAIDGGRQIGFCCSPELARLYAKTLISCAKKAEEIERDKK